jgi:hypothetical protein
MRYRKPGSVCDRERIPHRRRPARVDCFRVADHPLRTSPHCTPETLSGELFTRIRATFNG